MSMTVRLGDHSKGKRTPEPRIPGGNRNLPWEPKKFTISKKQIAIIVGCFLIIVLVMFFRITRKPHGYQMKGSLPASAGKDVMDDGEVAIAPTSNQQYYAPINYPSESQAPSVSYNNSQGTTQQTYNSSQTTGNYSNPVIQLPLQPNSANGYSNSEEEVDAEEAQQYVYNRRKADAAGQAGGWQSDQQYSDQEYSSSEE